MPAVTIPVPPAPPPTAVTTAPGRSRLPLALPVLPVAAVGVIAVVVVPALHNAVVLPVVATRVPTRMVMVIIIIASMVERVGVVSAALRLPLAVQMAHAEIPLLLMLLAAPVVAVLPDRMLVVMAGGLESVKEKMAVRVLPALTLLVVYRAVVGVVLEPVAVVQAVGIMGILTAVLVAPHRVQAAVPVLLVVPAVSVMSAARIITVLSDISARAAPQAISVLVIVVNAYQTISKKRLHHAIV